jgi:hypothetical protein
MDQLKYFKERKKRIFKMNNMVAILSNLNTTMCHAFIFNKSQMLALINIDLNSLEGENAKVVATQK